MTKRTQTRIESHIQQLADAGYRRRLASTLKSIEIPCHASIHGRPDSPMVYGLIDRHGEVVYVGAARRGLLSQAMGMRLREIGAETCVGVEANNGIMKEVVEVRVWVCEDELHMRAVEMKLAMKYGTYNR